MSVVDYLHIMVEFNICVRIFIHMVYDLCNAFVWNGSSDFTHLFKTREECWRFAIETPRLNEFRTELSLYAKLDKCGAFLRRVI